MLQRRKSLFAASAAAGSPSAKHDARRPGAAPLSLAGLLLSLFLVATFLYCNQGVVNVKPHPRPAASADLRLLQEAAHHEVNSRPPNHHHHLLRPSNHHHKDDNNSDSDLLGKKKDKANKGQQALQLVRVLHDAPTPTIPPPVPVPVSVPATINRNSSSSAWLTVPRPSCDVYRGWWTYDAEGAQAPLYREHECEFLTEQVTCMRNGRRDDSYQRWRWQPTGCDLPRFDARLLLERLRNKRLMFVGDSLNRNQWESMVCLVQSAIPKREHKTLAKFVGANGSLNVFTATEYNATVEFYWAPFLVQSNSDDPQVHSVRDRIIAWRSIAKHAKHWKHAHYLVFNTYIWWLNTFEMKVLKNSRVSSKYTLVDRPVAYREVLKTWAKWVDRHIDPTKTMVFFMGMSPNHITPDAWGGEAGAVKCAMETQPILNRRTALEIGTDWRLHGAAEGVIRSMRRVPVHLVDITALSEFRKDAHTSVHTLRQGKLLTKEQQADPKTYADCIHWCLPGLPDTWNHFLYTHIASSPFSSSSSSKS